MISAAAAEVYIYIYCWRCTKESNQTEMDISILQSADVLEFA
jgi:hypothetical protein